uniref:Peptidase M13 C-terminal domain-containing protein n=1 Tax=Caenorhabditis japonica TaxID=281687 RepID=A0A8R1HQA3_CAEJA
MNKNLKTNSLSETILKQLFGLCEKLPSLQEQHIISYRDLLADIKSVGAWPMIDPDFDESQFELTRYLENMAGNLTIRNYGLFTLNIHALVAILNDNDAYILPDGTREKLLEHVKNIIAEKGTKIDIKTIEKDMKDVDEFRQNLSQLGTYYDLKHAEDFEGFVSMNRPLINFEQILRNLVNPKNPEQWEIIKKNVYTSPTKWYLTENGQFHQLIQAIPPRTLANFLILRILQNALNLVKFTPDTKCGDVVIGRMPKAALRIYVRNFFKKENLKLGSELVTRIMFEYVKMFNSSTWLHQETKDSAISKIKKMRSVVGYPDEFEAPGALDKVYEDLFNMSPNDSFYTLLRKIDGFDLKRQMELVTHRPSLSFPTLVQSNAFYLNYYNMFVLSVPIIDEPFFSASLPSIARLAAVGFTIGHEIGHAFDHYGRQFDGDGKRVNWWSKEQEMEYHGREKCLIRQYQGYDAPKYGKGLDGRRVSKENIADLLGITTTWMAYKSLKDVADQPSIIGFEDYSPEKLFFHIVALKSCSTYDTLSLNERLNRVHPVNNFRVNGVFANMEAFSEAFQCPIGSPMNPEEKCTFF